MSIHQIDPAKRFEALVQPHFKVLYAAARRMTLSTVDAEDLVQDVCLKAFTRLDEFERIEYQRAWLLKMMYHNFIDNQRAEKRSPLHSAETGIDSFDPAELLKSSWQPEQMLEREVRITRILMALKALDAEQCALVALRDIEGLSIAELQELTGMPAGTIKSILHRTRAKLGRLLAADVKPHRHLSVVGEPI